MSAANASGSPWKLPVVMTSPSGTMTGLSTIAPSSVSMIAPGEREHVPDRAVHLRRAAQAVRVLDGVRAVPVAGQQLRAGQQGAQVGRAGQLARMRPDHLDPLVVGAVGGTAAPRPTARTRRRPPSPASSASCTENASSACIGSVPLTSDRPSFGASVSGCDPVLGEHLGGWAAAAAVARPAQPALADQRLGEVGELRQVAGRADGALARDHREQAEVQHLDQPGGQVGPDAGVAGRERPGARAAASRGRSRRSAAPPIAAAWDMTIARWSVARSCSPTLVSASAPKPVLTP